MTFKIVPAGLYVNIVPAIYIKIAHAKFWFCGRILVRSSDAFIIIVTAADVSLLLCKQHNDYQLKSLTDLAGKKELPLHISLSSCRFTIHYA